ncbi:MAG: hypothetical protein J0M04_11395 [Verrucomicrobia bacterium]|nr:hypothetical protein [Verrucomicrobiota bacterium]
MPEFIEEHLRAIIFVVIVGIALLQKILDAAKTRKQQSGPTMREIYAPDGQADPTPPRRKPYTPPPLVRTTQAPAGPPPLRQAPPPAPPPPLRGMASVAISTTTNTDAELARQRQLEERIRALREASATAAPEPSSATAPTAHRPAPAHHGVLHRRLRNPREIRRAFVLKEILDRPVGLR